jgi:hypothetical protein
MIEHACRSALPGKEERAVRGISLARFALDMVD